MFVSSIIIIVIIIILILMNTIKFIVTLSYYREPYCSQHRTSCICQLLPFEQYNLSELTAGSDLLFFYFMVN